MGWGCNASQSQIDHAIAGSRADGVCGTVRLGPAPCAAWCLQGPVWDPCFKPPDKLCCTQLQFQSLWDLCCTQCKSLTSYSKYQIQNARGVGRGFMGLVWSIDWPHPPHLASGLDEFNTHELITRLLQERVLSCGSQVDGGAYL